MKNIKNLDEFDGINEADSKTDEKNKFRFEISANLKKVIKMQKTLLDMVQMVTEMNDEIVSLRTDHPSMNPDSMKLLNNMKFNLENISTSLRKEHSRGSKTGVISNSNRLRSNLEKLKNSGLNI